MSGWAIFFLGVIAVATLGTAIVQIGLIVYANRLAGRMTKLLDEVERELKPLLANANAVGRDAARAASLAVAQMERADQVFGELAARIEEILTTVRQAVAVPAREGMAVLAGLRAAIAVFRGLRKPPDKKRAEDEEALFI